VVEVGWSARDRTFKATEVMGRVEDFTCSDPSEACVDDGGLPARLRDRYAGPASSIPDRRIAAPAGHAGGWRRSEVGHCLRARVGRSPLDVRDRNPGRDDYQEREQEAAHASLSPGG
jgi:hypothetical protein